MSDLQVRELEAAAPDKTVPFNVPLPDVKDDSVPTAHAIALTGDRVLTSFFRSQLPEPAAQSGPLHLEPTPAEVPADAASAKRKRVSDSGDGGDAPCAVELAPQPHTPLAGARQLAAVMRLEAPTRLTLQGVYDLLEACNVLLADQIVRNMPAYIAPALETAPLQQVRVQVERPCTSLQMVATAFIRAMQQIRNIADAIWRNH